MFVVRVKCEHNFFEQHLIADAEAGPSTVFVEGCTHPHGNGVCALDYKFDPVCCPMQCQHPTASREVRDEGEGPTEFCGECGGRL